MTKKPLKKPRKKPLKKSVREEDTFSFGPFIDELDRISPITGRSNRSQDAWSAAYQSAMRSAGTYHLDIGKLVADAVVAALEEWDR